MRIRSIRQIRVPYLYHFTTNFNSEDRPSSSMQIKLWLPGLGVRNIFLVGLPEKTSLPFKNQKIFWVRLETDASSRIF